MFYHVWNELHADQQLSAMNTFLQSPLLIEPRVTSFLSDREHDSTFGIRSTYLTSETLPDSMRDICRNTNHCVTATASVNSQHSSIIQMTIIKSNLLLASYDDESDSILPNLIEEIEHEIADTLCFI